MSFGLLICSLVFPAAHALAPALPLHSGPVVANLATTHVGAHVTPQLRGQGVAQSSVGNVELLSLSVLQGQSIRASAEVNMLSTEAQHFPINHFNAGNSGLSKATASGSSWMLGALSIMAFSTAAGLWLRPRARAIKDTDVQTEMTASSSVVWADHSELAVAAFTSKSIEAGRSTRDAVTCDSSANKIAMVKEQDHSDAARLNQQFLGGQQGSAWSGRIAVVPMDDELSAQPLPGLWDPLGPSADSKPFDPKQNGRVAMLDPTGCTEAATSSSSSFVWWPPTLATRSAASVVAGPRHGTTPLGGALRPFYQQRRSLMTAPATARRARRVPMVESTQGSQVVSMPPDFRPAPLRPQEPRKWMRPMRKSKRKHRHHVKTDGEGNGEPNIPVFGKYGIKAVEHAWVTSRQLEWIRRRLVQHMGRRGKVFIRSFPHQTINQRFAESRQGFVQGRFEYWVAAIKPEFIMIEVDGVSEETAYQAFRAIMRWLPIKVKWVKRPDRPSDFALDDQRAPSEEPEPLQGA